MGSQWLEILMVLKFLFFVEVMLNTSFLLTKFWMLEVGRLEMPIYQSLQGVESSVFAQAWYVHRRLP